MACILFDVSTAVERYCTCFQLWLFRNAFNWFFVKESKDLFACLYVSAKHTNSSMREILTN
jgi:hypothetical protein